MIPLSFTSVSICLLSEIFAIYYLHKFPSQALIVSCFKFCCLRSLKLKRASNIQLTFGQVQSSDSTSCIQHPCMFFTLRQLLKSCLGLWLKFCSSLLHQLSQQMLPQFFLLKKAFTRTSTSQTKPSEMHRLIFSPSTCSYFHRFLDPFFCWQS